MNLIILLSIALLIIYFSQALKTLILQENRIGHKGAQHFAIALQENKVTSISHHFAYC
jgi:lipoprotein signal peptidase